MAFTVAAGTSVKQLLELAVDSEVDHAPDAEPAGVAAVVAIQLAKLAQSLPGVLAAQANCARTAQTVRKLPEFGVKQREERAVRESERWASSAA